MKRFGQLSIQICEDKLRMKTAINWGRVIQPLQEESPAYLLVVILHGNLFVLIHKNHDLNLNLFNGQRTYVYG
jgi:hypothetical protein